jgi:hypothetical protein
MVKVDANSRVISRVGAERERKKDPPHVMLRRMGLMLMMWSDIW